LAVPLTSSLSANREEGKKGLTKRVSWKDNENRAFQKLNEALLKELDLFQTNPDNPFILPPDASERAIGVVLEQKREGALNTHRTIAVAFFSRKLGKSQLNWTPEAVPKPQ
jgi:hypothetical protein